MWNISYLNRQPRVFNSATIRRLREANEVIRALRAMGAKTLSCRAGETIEIIVDRDVGVIDVSAFPRNVHIRANLGASQSINRKECNDE